MNGATNRPCTPSPSPFPPQPRPAARTGGLVAGEVHGAGRRDNAVDGREEEAGEADAKRGQPGNLTREVNHQDAAREPDERYQGDRRAARLEDEVRDHAFG